MSRYRDTRIHGRETIARFLRAVDRNLSKSTTVVIIGGGAAVFHHATTTTNDIDTYDALSVELETWGRARRATDPRDSPQGELKRVQAEKILK